MRAAPAVDYPVSQEGWWRRASVALGGVVAAVPAAWAASHLASQSPLLYDPLGGPRAWAQAVCMLLAALPAAGVGGWMGWRLSRVAAGSIFWDGGAWFRRGVEGTEPQPGRPELALDWGRWMLLRWRFEAADAAAASTVSPHRNRATRLACIPLAQRDLPSHWHLLRVALRHSVPRAAGSTAAEGGSP